MNMIADTHEITANTRPLVAAINEIEKSKDAARKFSYWIDKGRKPAYVKARQGYGTVFEVHPARWVLRLAKLHPDCQLNVEPFYQCCCTCKYRVKALRRWPWWVHRIMRILHLPRLPLFIPGKQWACVAYDLSHVETHWPEHSCGCELHTPRDK